VSPGYQFDNIVVDPCGVQENVPIWVGGNTQRSLRRAVELGDGWFPFGVSPERTGVMLGKAAQAEA
jgi:alkanesulfonate monooxygenase SsuD/methylene tetrahydromethanopterin reductase-like flavin-dependent oxidoreductase (luciferase family)